MQEVGGEAAPEILELVHGGAAHVAVGDHGRLFGRAATLAQVARRAGGDDVLPAGAAAAGARQDVVEGQVGLRAAVLAGEGVPQEKVEARKGRRPVLGDVGLERHHARQLHLEGRRVDHEVVGGHDLDPLQKNRLDDLLPGPQR